MTPAAVFKRLTAVAGMALLVPICLGLIGGSVSPFDAGLRALSLLAAVLIVRRFANLAPNGPTVVVEMDDDGSR